jgi:gluconate 2-dehydrogenase gamma chain
MSSEKKKGLTRRDAIKAMGASALGLSAAYGVTPPALENFKKMLREGNYVAQFFTDEEMVTLRALADMVIPADDRSGSATDAGTAEYADFVLSISGEDTQGQWREGLAWLDSQCSSRFGNERFAACTDAERSGVLDDIAWPARATEQFTDKAQWFNNVRNLIGSGFFSSEMGVADVGYIGNVFNPVWEGAPPEALEELGLSYDEWNEKYGHLR